MTDAPRYTPELIVRQIAADRIPRHALTGRCRYCAAAKNAEHIELCVWRQARAWVERDRTEKVHQ